MRELLQNKMVWIGAVAIVLLSFGGAAGVNLGVVKPLLALPDGAAASAPSGAPRDKPRKPRRPQD